MAAAGAPRRGRRAVRHGARGRPGAVPARSASPSRSARTRCRCGRRGSDGGSEHAVVVAPLSLIVSAFAPVRRRAAHADAAAARRPRATDAACWSTSAAAGTALGGSVAGAGLRPARRTSAPDLDDPGAPRGASSPRSRSCARRACCSPTTTASDGGLFATLAEMAFAGALRPRRSTLSAPRRRRLLAALFAEELGAVLQVRAADARTRVERARAATASTAARRSARPTRDERDPHHARRRARSSTSPRVDLQRAWSRDHLAMQRLRDDPECAPRGVRPDPRRRATRASRRALDLRSRRRRRRAVRRARRAAARSRSCASRASTARSRWRRPSTAPASRPYDVHMSDLIAGRVDARRLRGLRRLRRLLLRRRARRRRGLGQVDPVQRPRARRVRRPSSRGRDTLRARRLQRLPDDEQPARADPRRRRTGRASCATAPSSSRRALVLVEVLPIAVALLRRHGRQPHAGRDRARRGPGRVPRRRRSSPPREPWWRCAIVDNRGAPTERYPDNPNGSPQGITGAHHRRRPRSRS